MNAHQRLNGGVLWCLVASVLIGLSAVASAEISPSVNWSDVSLPELIAKTSFICKGEIIVAPEVKTIRGSLPRKTGIAKLRIDACLKGRLQGVIDVAADEYRPAAGWSGGGHSFQPKVGEYLLLFMRGKGTTYELADDVGALPVSSQTTAAQITNDPLLNLENDFEAGLHNADHEVVLNSITWLGDLQSLHSTDELKSLLKNADPVTRLYVWETLLKTGDLSQVPEIGNYLSEFDPQSRSYSLPRDRLPLMQLRVFRSFCQLRDPVVISYLEHFAQSPNPRVRVDAIQGLRKIGSIRTAPVFLKALDDHQEDIDFIAMQSLLELAGGGPIPWVPTWNDFKKTPEVYAARCREWWASEGEARAQARAASRISFRQPQWNSNAAPVNAVTFVFWRWL